MSAFIPILRFVHVMSAIFWVGTTLFMLFFLEPTVRSLGPDGGKFMQRLLGGTRFSLAISLAGILTVLSGVLMFGPFVNWSSEIMLGARLPLTLGAIAGIAAGVVGFGVNGRASARLQALGQQMATQGGPPTEEQRSEMAQLQERLRQGSIWAAILMVAAVIGMTW